MFWTATWELDFQQAFSFERIAKKIRVHHLKAEKTHLNGLDFWQKKRKTLFWGCFCGFPTKWNLFFRKNSTLSRYFPIRHPIFTYNFRKNLWTVLAKKRLLTGLLSYWLTVVISWDRFLTEGECPKTFFQYPFSLWQIGILLLLYLWNVSQNLLNDMNNILNSWTIKPINESKLLVI